PEDVAALAYRLLQVYDVVQVAVVGFVGAQPVEPQHDEVGLQRPHVGGIVPPAGSDAGAQVERCHAQLQSRFGSGFGAFGSSRHSSAMGWMAGWLCTSVAATAGSGCMSRSVVASCRTATGSAAASSSIPSKAAETRYWPGASRARYAPAASVTTELTGL